MITRHQALRARVAEQLTRLPIRPTHAPAASAAEAVENQIDAASGKGFFRILLVLLCHKILAPIRRRLSGMEILTRGGGLWVSNPRHVAANHGSAPMSRRSRRGW